MWEPLAPLAVEAATTAEVPAAVLPPLALVALAPVPTAAPAAPALLLPTATAVIVEPMVARVSTPAPPPPPTTNTTATRILAPTINIRPSAAPVPFAIPLHAASQDPPSRNFLRVHRPITTPAATPRPDLLDALRVPFTPIRERVTGFAGSLQQRATELPNRLRVVCAAGLARARTPAPWFHIPTPYDELLIVNVTLGPLEVLWRSIGWPVAAFMGMENLTLKIWNPLKRIRFQIPYARFQLLRHSFAFAGALALILLPLKLAGVRPELRAAGGRVLGATANAFDDLHAGGAALARSSFTEAIASFERARGALDALPETAWPGGRVLASAARRLPGLRGSIGRAEDLRRASVALATAASSSARGLALLERTTLGDPDAAANLRAAAAAFASARIRAEGARPAIASSGGSLAVALDHGLATLRRAEAFVPIAAALGGIDRPRRLLLVFQNPAELRPTGGFLGAFALVDVRNGHATSLELPGGGAYDISGLSRQRVQPPEPLRILADTWQFHDANWFPDFPTSARKLRAFYEAGGGPSVDAVIAVNAPLLADILAATGPITAGGRTFSSTDVLAVLTDTVEDPAARATGKPKAILADLAPELLRRLLALSSSGDGDRLVLLDRVLRALDERDLQLAFTDDAVQATVAGAGWDGMIRPAPRDALFVVHANLGGGKSDARIADDVAHRATILADGTIVDEVTITRTHRGVPGAGATPSDRLANMANMDYLRVYVPRGAMLLTADGFTPPPPEAFEVPPPDATPDRDLAATELGAEVDSATGLRVTEEFGRTVFGGWLRTMPGESQSVRIAYRLPWRYEATRRDVLGRMQSADAQPYSILLQAQSGTRATVRHALEVDPTWQTTWVSANLRRSGDRTWTIEDILTTDRFAGIMISPR